MIYKDIKINGFRMKKNPKNTWMSLTIYIKERIKTLTLATKNDNGDWTIIHIKNNNHG